MGSLEKRPGAITSPAIRQTTELDQALNLIDVLREALYDTVVQLREAKLLIADIQRVAKRTDG